MKLKQSIRYQLADFIGPVIVYYGIVAAAHVVLFLAWIFTPATIHLGGGLTVFSGLFLFICGLCSFHDNLPMHLQNGVSRKTMYTAWLVVTVIVSAAMAAADTVLATLIDLLNLPIWRGSSNMFLSLFDLEGMGFGATFVNTLFSFPFSFVLLALLDNSSGEQRRAVEKRLGVEIEMISLLKSRIVSLENGAPPAPALADLTGAAGSAPTLLDPGIFLPGTGRRLMTQERLAALRRACRTAADKIGAPDAPRTLYLGSGELIYAPALIAGFCGGGAFHSTTQSPVFPLPGSAIVSGVRFDPADCYSAAGYLYNVPDGAYERAYLFAERGAFIERGARQLTQYLSMRGIKSVSVVML